MELKDAKVLLKEDDDLIITVYDYWLNKRLNHMVSTVHIVRNGCNIEFYLDVLIVTPQARFKWPDMNITDRWLLDSQLSSHVCHLEDHPPVPNCFNDRMLMLLSFLAACIDPYCEM